MTLSHAIAYTVIGVAALYGALFVIVVITTIIVAAIEAAARAALALWRNREQAVGDDAVNLTCRHCAGERHRRCTCASDCGKPLCDWEFEQALAAALRPEMGADELGRPQ